MTLKERSQSLIDEIGLPYSRFAKNVGLSTDAFRKWLLGQLKVKAETEQRIDDFLKSLNR